MIIPTQDSEARKAILTYLQIKKEVDITRDYIITDTEVTSTILLILEKLGYYKGLPSNIEEALNSGDGVYRP